MRVLMISDNKINGLGGGSLCEKRNFLSILNLCTDKDSLKVISLDSELDGVEVLQMDKNKKMDLVSRFLGHSTYLFMQRKKIYSLINSGNFDYIFLGRSRLGFVAKYVKKKHPTIKIITCMENIEFDYAVGYFSNKSGIKKKIMLSLEKKCIKKDEGDSIKFSDTLVYLSTRDVNRAHELYIRDYSKKKELICPICLEKGVELKVESDKKNVVFVGSLGYASNSNAVISFLKTVWDGNFSDNDAYHFIVAGRNPDNALTKEISRYSNCSLVSNFNKLEDFVPIGSLMIAPIEKGAGMKTKVAESLSMGLSVVGTEEAFVGYENALNGDKYSSLVLCDKISEMKNAIEEYFLRTNSDLKKINDQNKKLFENYYSYSYSFEVFKEVFNKTV